MRIGLFGGSFNPAHDGHRLVSDAALKRLRLDRVWWLTTPGNPLKVNGDLPPQRERMRAAAQFLDDPRVAVTGLERRLGTRYTLDTVRKLILRHPGVRFVWLMGADNLRQFPRWKGWREIARLMPIAVIDRSGASLSGPLGHAAQTLRPWRVDERAAGALADRKAPAWTLLHGRRSPLSSTKLRAARAKSMAAPG
jgi:nicotinate-nucleotide adenylyltransferase